MKTIEQIVNEYLSEQFEDIAPVFGVYPDNAPYKLIATTFTGRRIADHLHSAVVAVQSYDATVLSCADLNEAVIASMLNLPESSDRVSEVTLNSGGNFPDTTRKRNRYQAVFNITYFEEGF